MKAKKESWGVMLNRSEMSHLWRYNEARAAHKSRCGIVELWPLIGAEGPNTVRCKRCAK